MPFSGCRGALRIRRSNLRTASSPSSTTQVRTNTLADATLLTLRVSHRDCSLSLVDVNPDRDTTAQFQMLNRAYEVLRDPKLKKAYDAFGIKGIGTSAASDNDNMARANARTQQNARTYTRTQQEQQNARASRASTQQPYSQATSAQSDGGYSDYVGTSDFSGKSWSSSGRSSTGGGRSVSVDDTLFKGGMGANSKSGRASTTAQTRTGTTGAQTPGNFRNTASTTSGYGPSEAWPSGFSAPKKGSSRATDAASYHGHMGEVHVQTGGTSPFNNVKTNTNDDGTMFVNGETFFGRGPKFGRDVLVDVEIDLATANAGGNKTIEVRHMKPCGSCQGTGTKVGSSISVCHHCDGKGYIVDGTQRRQECTACNGVGQKITNPCNDCKGHGIVSKTRQMLVKIPRGVDDGYSLRIPGEGDAGPNGGPAGDLYVCFSIPEMAKQKAKERGTQPNMGPRQVRSRPQPRQAPKAVRPDSIYPGMTIPKPKPKQAVRSTASGTRSTVSAQSGSAVRPNDTYQSVGKIPPPPRSRQSSPSPTMRVGTAGVGEKTRVRPDSVRAQNLGTSNVRAQSATRVANSRVGTNSMRAQTNSRVATGRGPQRVGARAPPTRGTYGSGSASSFRAQPVSARQSHHAVGASGTSQTVGIQSVSQPQPKRRLGRVLGGVVNRIMRNRKQR